MNKYRLTRRGKKLDSSSDDLRQRTIAALSKNVPERIWADLFQKDDEDMMVYEIREEILEGAMKIVYEHYMERQNIAFTAHCATKAWLKLIDWYFFPHDPGEDTSAQPPCYIPKRDESWTPDDLPRNSPKDSCAAEKLPVSEEDLHEETVQKPSTSSLEMTVVEDIPSQYWFPGKINLYALDKSILDGLGLDWLKKDTKKGTTSSTESASSSGLVINADSEVVQNVTDYSSDDEVSERNTYPDPEARITSNEGSLHGAGDFIVHQDRPRNETSKGPSSKSNVFSKSKVFGHKSMHSRSRGNLPPLGDSRITIISDCRLRSLRTDIQYEIHSEKNISGGTNPPKKK